MKYKLFFLFAFLHFAAFSQDQTTKNIEIIFRGDDIGSAQAINEACLKTYKEGIVRSVEIMVPGAWFLQAAKMLNENPGLDVGVHLVLTSEWENCKWRPLTYCPTLTDENGYFYPMNHQRNDFPPKTGLFDQNPSLQEIEQELRAQIEMAKKHIPHISHLSCHMGSARISPEVKMVTEKLAKEYNLPLETENMGSIGRFKTEDNTPEKKEAALLEMINKLKPGRYLFVEHPGFDTPEMRALGHINYWNVAEDRAAVTYAFTSKKVQELIKKKGIKLISYKNLNL